MGCGRTVALLTSGILIGAVLFGCNSHTHSGDDLQRQMLMLEGNTAPPGSEIVARSGPFRNEWSLTASWEVETKSNRAQYSEWVAARLQPAFALVRKEESRLVFSKYDNGDAQSLEIEFAPMKEKLHVRVLFRSYPD